MNAARSSIVAVLQLPATDQSVLVAPVQWVCIADAGTLNVSRTNSDREESGIVFMRLERLRENRRHMVTPRRPSDRRQIISKT
jgi:hypothetical protein